MRVLQLSWEYPPEIAGGLGRHVHGLSRALAALGTEVVVLTRGAPGPAVPDDGVVVHRVPSPPFPYDMDRFLGWVGELNAALAVAAATLPGGFDLVHSHDWLVADAARASARRAGVPWLVTVHATEHGRHAGRVATAPQSTVHAAERAMARDADHLITCSRWMRGHVADVLGVPATAITTLPNGLDGSALAPAGAVGSEPRGERRVLLVGRLVHEKGFDIALEALAPILRGGGGVGLTVAGAGPAEAELRHRAHELGLGHRVRFLGWVGDAGLRELYGAADVCVVPSRDEPFGIVALEAMAAGCACVVADTGGLREVVPGDETVGLRFAPGDAAALRAAVTRLLEDDGLRARLRARARVHARGYGWPRIAAGTADVYAGLLVRARTAA